jgi:ABC-type transport system substrate-binding protein
MRENTENKFINNAICVAILLNLIVFGSCSTLLMLSINREIYYNGRPEILKVATTSNPIAMDPCNSMDRESNNMLNQVVETLIAYDLTDPTFPLLGRLAESWVFRSHPTHGTNITFNLCKNVYFHDGQLFTGEDVIHTFERINFFGNWTGTLDPAVLEQAIPHFLYKFDDGTPIFNDTLSRALWETTKLIDEYTVTLIMNRPFGPAEEVLTYTSSAIVGHESTPKDRMLHLETDLLIGTGPFKLVRYLPDSEILFYRWERYWSTGAYWDEIRYIYYEDEATAGNAILRGDVDWLGQVDSSFKPNFEAHPDIIITGDGVKDYINGSIYWYILFKSEWINSTWRKAISYSFNYSYLIHEIEGDTVSRAHSFVNPSFPAYNSSVVGGTYNIPYARQIMQSMGYGYSAGVPWDIGSQVGDVFIPGSNETLWKAAEFIPNKGNFTNNEWLFHLRFGDYLLERLIQRFTDDMDLIGIKISPQGWSWDFWPIPPQFYERIHFFFMGINAIYFSCYNLIISAINPDIPYDVVKINDPEINAILNNIANEKDILQRYDYYKKIQYLFHDKYYYHMPLFYEKLYHVHTASLKGVLYNPMSNLYWYPTYRET